MLDENNQFIQAIVDFQSKGKAHEVLQWVHYFKILSWAWGCKEYCTGLVGDNRPCSTCPGLNATILNATMLWCPGNCGWRLARCCYTVAMSVEVWTVTLYVRDKVSNQLVSCHSLITRLARPSYTTLILNLVKIFVYKPTSCIPSVGYRGWIQ